MKKHWDKIGMAVLGMAGVALAAYATEVINDDVVINGDLGVNGDSTLNGAVSIDGHLDITWDAFFEDVEFGTPPGVGTTFWTEWFATAGDFFTASASDSISIYGGARNIDITEGALRLLGTEMDGYLTLEGELADANVVLGSYTGTHDAVFGTFTDASEPWLQLEKRATITVTADDHIRIKAPYALSSESERALLFATDFSGTAAIGEASGAIQWLGNNPTTVPNAPEFEGELAAPTAKLVSLASDAILAAANASSEGESEGEGEHLVITPVSSITCTIAGDVIVQLGN